MKNLILLTLILLAACGADDPGKVSYPPSMPPEDEVPSDGPPEWFHYANDEDGEPVYKRTRALYNATRIEVFYTPKHDINISSFASLASLCTQAGIIAGHDSNKVGVLNGMFKEQGYTRDFLLNPEVERTWHHSDGVIFTLIEANLKFEFDNPTATIDTCTDIDGNEVKCRRFMCGVDKTPEPVEETGPPEEIDFLIAGQGTVTINTKRLYDAEKIEIYYSSEFVVSEASTFRDMLAFCLTFSSLYRHSYDKIGLLNGIGKEDGYTKDFLLNPDVDRTWVHGTDDSDDLETYVDAEFTNPLANNAVCSNDRPCKKVMCGAVKGD